MSKIFFTSDMHFGHFNVIRHDNRPFNTVEEMDNTIIKNWNSVVSNKDTVYILGDASWYGPDKTCEILKQLNGNKILIKGNHDRLNDNVKRCYLEVCERKILKVPNTKENLVLDHYPVMSFYRQHHGSYMLYGHVHNSVEWQDVKNYQAEMRSRGVSCNMFNVGTMVNNYTPVSVEEILERARR